MESIPKVKSLNIRMKTENALLGLNTERKSVSLPMIMKLSVNQQKLIDKLESMPSLLSNQA
jgi:hypothetical protein